MSAVRHRKQEEEEDNRSSEVLLNELLKDVRSLKGGAEEIGGELKEHSSLFDRVSMKLTRARDSISKTTSKLMKGEALGGHVSHVWLLLVFAFLVFVFIFLMLKFKR